MTEALARLTAKTQDWMNLPAGVLELSGAEVAALLSGLDGGPLHVARAAWVGDSSVYPELITETFLKANKFFSRRDVVEMRSATGAAEPIRDLCCAAITQAVFPVLCVRCQGRGQIYPRGGAVRDCDACNATGQGRRAGDDVRRALGLPMALWERIQPKYYRIEIVLHDWLMVAAAQAWKNDQETA